MADRTVCDKIDPELHARGKATKKTWKEIIRLGVESAEKKVKK